MNRRGFLAGACTCGVGALAGCTTGFGGGGNGGDPSPTRTDTDGGTEIASGAAGSVAGIPLPIPQSELRRGAAKDVIPAIVEPEFAADWSGVEYEARHPFGGSYTARPRLGENDHVVGVLRAGEARAYPLLMLNWHEIVNDSLGGPLLVTYCPLCGSAVTAVREVDGEETVFGVSGLLFKNDLVMYDRLTDSLWSQIAATAIRGPKTGETLDLVPSSLTTWGAWRAEYPDTVVLLPPPISNTVTGRQSTRNYDRNPYAGYSSSGQIGIGGAYDDDRLHPKTEVIGVVSGGVARAYPLDTVAKEQVVNDTVGDRPVVVGVAPGDSLVAYDRVIDGETLTFEYVDERHLRAGESNFRTASGVAIDGPLSGTQLTPANAVSPEFFFAWKGFHPDTEVYGVD